MLTYYARRVSSGEMHATTATSPDVCWVHGTQLVKSEAAELAVQYQLDKNIIADVFDANELPRIEYDERGNLYVFLRIAWRSRHGEVKTAPYLAIVAGRHYITLTQTPLGQPPAIADNRSSLKLDDTLQLLLQTVAAVTNEYEALIHHTAGTVRTLKQRLRSREATNQDFYRFITIEENLSIYHYHLAALHSIAERLHDDARISPKKHHLELLDDTMLHIRQLRASVDSATRTVASLYNVYSTVANNTLNQRMKTLTIVTLVVTIPNVFYGMYGMNIALPFASQPWAFAAVVGFTVVIMTLVLLLVRRSKLL